MEQRRIRNLSDNAKIIKITGQNTGPIDGVDCELDCHHKDPIRVYYPAPYTGCFQSVIIGYNEYDDAKKDIKVLKNYNLKITKEKHKDIVA